ncbi:MAG: thiamine pyrophosphate-dependent enzyme, partial [Acidimicrobiia bacterium]
AEKLRAPVWCAPACDRTPFPEDHPCFQGNLPFAIGPLCERLRGHDLVLVVGAPVFSYYPHVPGDYIPADTALLHITDDPNESARAPVGDSLLADAGLALAALVDLVDPRSAPLPTNGRVQPAEISGESSPLTPNELWSVLAQVRPPDAVLFEETPSNRRELHQWWPINTPRTFYTASSGGLGWAVPAAVGFALGDRTIGNDRHIVTAVGDGSFQFSFQGLWSAVQHELPVVFVVPRNGEYAILRAFAEAQDLPGVPGLTLPGLDIVSLAQGYLCPAVRAETASEVKEALAIAFDSKGPMLIEVPVQASIAKLV